MAPIINGTDGRKMSKSLGNCIFLDEDPTDVFGKCMSISDSVMEEWIPLLTSGISEEHPMEKKKKMAHCIVEQLFDTSTADSCLNQFQKSVQNSEIPEDISEIESDNIIDAVSKIRNCSRSEARRLLTQGAVSIDNKKASENTEIHAGQIIKAGKRNFGRIV